MAKNIFISKFIIPIIQNFNIASNTMNLKLEFTLFFKNITLNDLINMYIL